MTVNWSIASFCARNSSWNADYLHPSFISDRKITIPYICTLTVSTISCLLQKMPGMYRPRQSLRHTSGNACSPQYKNLLWDRMNSSRGKYCFDEKDKTTQGIIHYFWNRKELSFWKASLCFQLNYRRKNLKTPHLFEKFPCSESSCKWSRDGRYAF